MIGFTYYVNQSTNTLVGIYGEKMEAGVVYGPAVNMPQDPVEHFVPLPHGVDGQDGMMFHPEFWTKVDTSLNVR